MPPRSKVLDLPTGVKEELDRRLVAGGFQDYSGLAAWLAEQGYELSRSAVHRYGKTFEERLGALRVASEQAKIVVREMGDTGEMGEALTAIAQERTFRLLMDMEIDPEEVDYPKLVRAIAQLNATNVQQKKWRDDVQQRARKAADEVDALTRKAGLSDDAAAAIRAKILGVAS
ncbi:MAG: DUF3486 family protein [Bacteroidota bacterium]